MGNFVKVRKLIENILGDTDNIVNCLTIINDKIVIVTDCDTCLKLGNKCSYLNRVEPAMLSRTWIYKFLKQQNLTYDDLIVKLEQYCFEKL